MRHRFIDKGGVGEIIRQMREQPFDPENESVRDQFVSAFESCQAEIDRLRAIVATYPAFACGSPAYPGAECWFVYQGKLYCSNVVPMHKWELDTFEETSDALCRPDDRPELLFRASDCYSTREAAEAAAKGGVE